jgi:hypothetical protein
MRLVTLGESKLCLILTQQSLLGDHMIEVLTFRVALAHILFLLSLRFFFPFFFIVTAQFSLSSYHQRSTNAVISRYIQIPLI